MASAGRIAGLKIELEIDGSKFTKYLSTAQKEVSKVKNSLKDLEKSLKLNPTNTDLIKQKFELLGKSIDQTEKYLSDLNQKYRELSNLNDPTQKQVDQMNNLQREISDTEQYLISLEREYQNFGSVGIQQIQAVGKQMQELGSKIQDRGRDIQTLGYEWERIGAPFQAAFGFAVKEGAEFEKGMSAVKAVTGATSEEFAMLEVAARDMARQTVFSAGEVAEAEYYMGLAGWSAQESVDGLAGVLDLAAAGQVDLGRASSIVVDGITAMGYSADDSTHFVNVMAAAMSNSNTTVDLLGESFKYAAPLAGTLNYSVEDLTLGLGLMASAGIKGSQAGTGLRMAMKNMADPTKVAAANAAGFAISMDDGYGKALPFRDVIGQLRDQFGGLNLELVDEEGNLKSGEQLWEEYGDSLPASQMEKFRAVSELVGVRALPGVLGMINASQEDFDQLANAIDNADSSFVELDGHIYPVEEAIAKFGEETVLTEGRVVGVAEAMRNIQLDNLQGDLQLLKDNLADLGIEIYQTLVPYIRKFVDWIGQLADKFRNLSPEAKKVITVIGLIIAAIGPALLVVGGIVRGVGTVISSIGGVISVLGRLAGFIVGIVAPAISSLFAFVAANPIVLLVAAIVAAGVWLAAHWEEFVAAAKELWNGLVEFFTGLWEGVKWMFSDTWNAIKTFAIETWENIKEKAIELWSNIKDKTIELWTAIKDKVTELITAVKDKAIEIWTALKDKVVEIFTNVKNKIVELWTAIKTKVVEFVTNIKNKVIELWTALKEKVVSIVTGIKDRLTEIWNNIKTTVSNVVNNIKDHVSNVWTNIKETVSNLVESLKANVSAKWESIKAKVQSIVDTLKGFLSNAWNNIKSTATNVWEGIKNAITRPIESAREKVKSILDRIKGFFPISLGKIFSNFKLPHVSVSWKDIAGIVKVPSFSVDWYAKAMKNGMLLDGATIFGMNANGQPMGGGEVGKEWIVGQNSLMSMIQSAVGNNGISAEGVYNAVIQGMAHAKVDVYMDGKKVTNIVSRQIAQSQAAQTRYYGG